MPEGAEERDPWGKPVPWKLGHVWALEPGLDEEPGLLWCGTIPGGLFRSTNRGGSWEIVRQLRDHPARKFWFGGAAPDHLWAQHHNGVFRSTDGAASWHEIKGVPPSSFGFAVDVHPDYPDTAWFVPGISDERRIPVDGRVVVARTRDGGRSFDT